MRAFQYKEDRRQHLAGRAFGRPGRDAGFEQAGASVEFGQTVPRTRNQVEELWTAVDEVDDLGDQEEEERFGEVRQDGDAGEGHAADVAVGVADEDAGGVAVVDVDGEGDGEEREEDVE